MNRKVPLGWLRKLVSGHPRPKIKLRYYIKNASFIAGILDVPEINEFPLNRPLSPQKLVCTVDAEKQEIRCSCSQNIPCEHALRLAYFFLAYHKYIRKRFRYRLFFQENAIRKRFRLAPLSARFYRMEEKLADKDKKIPLWWQNLSEALVAASKEHNWARQVKQLVFLYQNLMAKVVLMKQEYYGSYFNSFVKQMVKPHFVLAPVFWYFEKVQKENKVSYVILPFFWQTEDKPFFLDLSRLFRIFRLSAALPALGYFSIKHNPTVLISRKDLIAKIQNISSSKPKQLFRTKRVSGEVYSNYFLISTMPVQFLPKTNRLWFTPNEAIYYRNLIPRDFVLNRQALVIRRKYSSEPILVVQLELKQTKKCQRKLKSLTLWAKLYFGYFRSETARQNFCRLFSQDFDLGEVCGLPNKIYLAPSKAEVLLKSLFLINPLESHFQGYSYFPEERVLVCRNIEKEFSLFTNSPIKLSPDMKIQISAKEIIKHLRNYGKTFVNFNLLFSITKDICSLTKKLDYHFIIEDTHNAGLWLYFHLFIEGVPAEELKKLLLAKSEGYEFYQLANGQVVYLRDLDRLFHIIKKFAAVFRFDSQKEGLLAEIPAVFVSDLVYYRKLQKVAIQRAKPFLERYQKLVNLSYSQELNLPDWFQANLRSYQKEGFLFLKNLYQNQFGGILADDMGLGKTVQAIALMSWLYQEKPYLFLVICPLAAIYVWESEVKKFAAKIPVFVHHGPKRLEHKLPDRGIILTSYGTFLKDYKQFENLNFEVVFFDEAQQIKNFFAKTTQKVRCLKSKSRFCLTGTPVENAIQEIWNLLDLVMPGILGSRIFFRSFFGSGVEIERLELLNQAIKPFVLRRKKEQVIAELPAKTVNTVFLPLEKEHEMFYLKEKTYCRMNFSIENEENKSNVANILSLIMRLRRAAIQPNLGYPKKRSYHQSVKMKYLWENLPTLLQTSRGILIFSQFTDVLDVVEDLLQDLQISYYRIDGSVGDKARRKMVEGFQRGERKVFLITLKAGGVSLTLTRADVVIHMDPWWNVAQENQAMDRAHRIGQDRPVTVYKLISVGTIEQMVLAIQESKKKMFEDVLENPALQNLNPLTLKELQELLTLATKSEFFV